MADYISKQDAINTACAYIVEYCGAAFEEDMQKSLKRQLDSIPSADVRTNTTGKWIEPDNAAAILFDIWTCSNCKKTTDHKRRFCPNCGADMRGGK